MIFVRFLRFIFSNLEQILLLCKKIKINIDNRNQSIVHAFGFALFIFFIDYFVLWHLFNDRATLKFSRSIFLIHINIFYCEMCLAIYADTLDL